MTVHDCWVVPECNILIPIQYIQYRKHADKGGTNDSSLPGQDSTIVVGLLFVMTRSWITSGILSFLTFRPGSLIFWIVTRSATSLDLQGGFWVRGICLSLYIHLTQVPLSFPINHWWSGQDEGWILFGWIFSLNSHLVSMLMCPIHNRLTLSLFFGICCNLVIVLKLLMVTD